MATMLFAASALAEPDFTSVQELLGETNAENRVAGGCVLVLHHGKVVFGEGFGFADRDTKTPFELDTPVVIASISKPLLGTAAFRIAEDGKLDLSVPISRYLPEFKDAALESGYAVERAPKTFELFSHTSGMRSDAATGGRPWYASWTRGKTLMEVTKRFAREFPFKAQPGTRFAYSGIGTDVAARVLEVVTKQSRNELFVTQVCKPLDLQHTRYRDAESVKHFGKMPTRYYRGKNGSLLVSRKRRLPKKNNYSSSGGTVISTAPDLARWLLMIRNRGEYDGQPYLSEAAITELLSPGPRGSFARGGFAIRKKDSSGKALVIGHTGSSGTNCWIDFENDIIGVVLTQTRGSQTKSFRLELEKRIRACINAE